MGGFFPQPVCVQLLEKAVEHLFHDGHDEESEAVEQAVALLKAWPKLSEWELRRGKTIKFLGVAERANVAIRCDCGGYAARVDTTPEEYARYGCAGHRGCCDRAFVCAVCSARIVGRALAPDGE